MRKNIVPICVSVLAVLFVIAVPFSFVFGEALQGACRHLLKLRIHESYSGGRVVSSFYDPSGDDKGGGEFTYPLSEIFLPGALDIIKYTVHEPVSDYRSGDYWQCGIVLGNISSDKMFPFGCVRVSVYVDVDGAKSGSTQGLAGDEDARFDPAHPWDFAMIIDGFSTTQKIYFSDGSEPSSATIIFLPKKNRILARVLLDNKRTGALLAGTDSWHYVFTKGYDRLSAGGVLPVKETESLRSGGGNPDGGPAIYDYLLPRTTAQSGQSTPDYIAPLHCSFKSAAARIDLDALETESAAYLKKKSVDEKDTQGAPAPEGGSLQQGIAFFREGRLDEAEKILTAFSQTSEGLAYLGAVVASKGGKTESTFEAVEFVNEGFEKMDKACAMAQNDIEYITARLCRANTAIEIPEEVFHKCAQGAHDFEEAALKLRELGAVSDADFSDMLVKAAICADKAGDFAYSESLFIKAGSAGFTPYGKFEAAKRDIIL